MPQTGLKKPQLVKQNDQTRSELNVAWVAHYSCVELQSHNMRWTCFCFRNTLKISRRLSWLADAAGYRRDCFHSNRLMFLSDSDNHLLDQITHLLPRGPDDTPCITFKLIHLGKLQIKDRNSTWAMWVETALLKSVSLSRHSFYKPGVKLLAC